MSTFIYSLFISLAIRMSVVTVFVIAVKLMFGKKLTAFANCALWLIPLVQNLFCLADVKIPSKTSIYNAAAGTELAENLLSGAGDIRNIIALVYILGVIIISLWYITVFVLHMIKLRGMPCVTEGETAEMFESIKQKLRIKSGVKLKRGEYAHTFLKSVIVPNGYSLSEERQIILHELCHYRHRDNLKLHSGVLVICLNWFNPLVWAAFRMFRNDIEMYCDESVLKLTDNRGEYARVLVKTASARGGFMPVASGAASSRHEVVKRIKRIVSWKKKKPFWVAASLSAAVLAACVCLTDAVNDTAYTNTYAPTAEEPSQTPAALALDTAENSDEPYKEAADETVLQPTAEPIRQPSATSHTEKAAVSASAPAKSTPSQKQVNTHKAQNSTGTANNDAAPIPDTAVAVPAAAGRDADTASSAAAPSAAENNNNSGSGALGERRSVSANGAKETYKMEDGRTAVLQYDDGELKTGYILNGDE